MRHDQALVDLLSRMTWEEKLAQLQMLWVPDTAAQHDAVRAGIGAMFWPVGAEKTNELQRVAREETRLGIPLLIGLDVVHGQYTIFPTPLAQASSFDPDVAAVDGRISASEARSNGVNWTFSPMVDVSYDARWGRVVEGFGENPYLTSAFTRAKVSAYQGDDLSSSTSVASCLKHFVAYGAAEAGRDYNTTDVSQRRLRDVYLKPFHEGVASGAASVMASFNSLNGTPMHANRDLLTDVLKTEWDFPGVVAGDADGASQLRAHGVVDSESEALALSVNAGVDVIMGGDRLADIRVRSEHRIRETFEEQRVDDAVYRILTLKKSLGLFEESTVDPSLALTGPTEDSLSASQWAAERSVVLLKNEALGTTGGVLLPIAPDSEQRILLTGPFAHSTDHLGAWVQRTGSPARSLSETLQDRFAAVDWTVLPGCDFIEPSTADVEAAVDAARGRDLVIVAVGEPSHLSGEASSRSNLDLPGHQSELVRALAATGVPLVVVVIAGRPLILEPWIDEVAAVLFTFHLGSRGPEALARIIAGDVDPGGRLPMTIPRSVGQIPIYFEHESTGRPARTAGSLTEQKHDVELEGPNNLDDSYTSKFLDLPLGPRFPFGHGGSYTTFEVVEIVADRHALTPAQLRAGEVFTISVEVQNTGERDGDHVVLLALTDPVASISQPVRRLCGFQRVHLAPGQWIRVDLTVGMKEIEFWNDRGECIIEPGALDFSLVGEPASSAVRVDVVAEAAAELPS